MHDGLNTLKCCSTELSFLFGFTSILVRVELYLVMIFSVCSDGMTPRSHGFHIFVIVFWF